MKTRMSKSHNEVFGTKDVALVVTSYFLTKI